MQGAGGIVCAMDKELRELSDRVAGKIEQAAQLVERLRADNAALRLRLAVVETERNHLQAQMVSARDRLQNLMDRIPEEARS